MPVLLLAFLAIEFLDELVYSGQEAAWPFIRTDLQLSYLQIGLLLSLPGIIGNLIESGLGILADLGKRRILIRTGGVLFALAAVLVAISRNYLFLLLALCLASPASGAFVSLSQAALMDAEPARHEQNMARWTLAGSLAVVAGPLALGAAVALGAGWRGMFIFFGALGFLLVSLVWRHPGLSNATQAAVDPSVAAKPSFIEGVRSALAALRRKDVLRWLVLLEFSDLMLDVLLGYLALYFVDVVGITPVLAGFSVAVWTGVGLAGDFLLIPLLERVRGLAYLRYSALMELILFPAFLLAPWLPVKLALLGLLGFFNSGWYSILMGQLYSAMPGQSGKVLTLNNAAGLFGKLIPLGIGAAAEAYGLGSAIWLLMLGPVALLIGLPRAAAGSPRQP